MSGTDMYIVNVFQFTKIPVPTLTLSASVPLIKYHHANYNR